MNILVTGGAGFIGSHLVKRLLKEHSVICVDSLVTGKKENISDIDNTNFSFIEHDITMPLKIKEDIGMIFNLASPASPVDFNKLKKEILLVNSLGTYNMLELAKEKNAVFFQASTSEVYGDPKEHPQKESYFGNVNSFGPRSCYDEGKRFSEAMCTSYPELNIKIARIFNTYGPRMRLNDGRVMINFITQALRGEDMTVYGSGEQTRSFCYVDDTVEGFVKIAFSASNGVYNVGSTDEYKIIDIAKKIKELTNSGSKIVFRSLPVDDPTKRKPDITKIKSLGWFPAVGLEQGLEKMIGWFRNT